MWRMEVFRTDGGTLEDDEDIDETETFIMQHDPQATSRPSKFDDTISALKGLLDEDTKYCSRRRRKNVRPRSLIICSRKDATEKTDRIAKRHAILRQEQRNCRRR